MTCRKLNKPFKDLKKKEEENKEKDKEENKEEDKEENKEEDKEEEEEEKKRSHHALFCSDRWKLNTI